ncbi:unnamed protein product, partial [Prorocentrum cordatum]
ERGLRAREQELSPEVLRGAAEGTRSLAATSSLEGARVIVWRAAAGPSVGRGTGEGKLDPEGFGALSERLRTALRRPRRRRRPFQSRRISEILDFSSPEFILVLASSYPSGNDQGGIHLVRRRYRNRHRCLVCASSDLL